jgi:bifunctional DNase/RNase
MKKIELKVLGLSYSQTQVGSYVIVLSEVDGDRKLPIIIKPAEAQVIALKIEGMKSPRPLTHDLFKNFADSFGIDVQEVFIHNVAEGVFYTKLVATNGLDDAGIECTAGDGIALAITFDCNIFVNESVLNSSGIIMDENGVASSTSSSKSTKSLAIEEPKKIVSIEDLEQLMKEAEENEEYEIAEEIRDRIKTLRQKQSK